MYFKVVHLKPKLQTQLQKTVALDKTNSVVAKAKY